MLKLLSRLAWVRAFAAWAAHQSLVRVAFVLTIAAVAAAVVQQGRIIWDAKGGDAVEAELPAQYDAMVRARWRALQPDPRLIIIDIDERSLAKMAPEFGRWPWPRDTLAAVLERIEAQQPLAILLDIQLADPDRLQPGGDAALAEALTRAKRVYVPVVRLDPATDATSDLRLKQLPGLWELPPQALQAQREAAGNQRLAAIPPFMEAAVRSTRMGLVNATPDADSVVRHYDFLDTVVDGEGDVSPRLRSLPARVVRDLSPGLAIPDEPVLLNWPSRAFRYPSVSFHDVFADTQMRQPKRSPTEFTGKIVLIGATAPSLFDLKATPIRAVHPGVEILAVATDNLLNGQWLRIVPPLWSLAAMLLLIGLFVSLALAVGYERVGILTVVVPLALLAVSFLSLNIGRTFWDFSASAALALGFFGALKAAALLREWHWTGALDAPSRRAQNDEPVWVLAWHGSEAQVDDDEAWFRLLKRHAPDGRTVDWTDWRDTTPRRAWASVRHVIWRQGSSEHIAEQQAQALIGELTPWSGRSIMVKSTARALAHAMADAAARALGQSTTTTREDSE